MRLRTTALTVLLAVLLSGCADALAPADQPADPQQTLREAATRTLAAESIHFDAELTLGGKHDEGFADYVAPNSFRSVFETETIIIGSDIYMESPSGRKRFSLYREPCGVTTEDLLPFIVTIQQAEDVTVDSGTFRFIAPDDPEGEVEGEARIEDGLIVHASLVRTFPNDDVVREVFSMSGFGSAITIEPPPAHLVDQEDTDLGVPVGPSSEPSCPA